MKHFVSKLDKFDSNLWYYHIKVPVDIVEFFSDAKDKRFICILNEQMKIHCAFMPTGTGRFFININKEVRKTLKIDVGDEVAVQIEKDESKYGMAVCEEFQEILNQDIEFSEYFHKLTKGKQRNLIYLAGNAKTSNTRINKSIAIAEYIKLVAGNLDFKELNQFFKDFRKL